MIYRVAHKTVYQYAEAVSLYQSEVRLTPRDTVRQTCARTRLSVDPVPAVAGRRVDWFGNHVTSFTVQEHHEVLTVDAVSEVEVRAAVHPDPADTPVWETVRDEAPGDRSRAGLDACQYLFESPFIGAVPEATAYAAESFAPGRPILEALLDLTARIKADFAYVSASTQIGTPLEEVLKTRRGVCQDFAHLQIAGLRGLGLPARYVIGYMRTDPPPGRPRLVGADASHAWVSAWCPPLGWVDVDPTNNLLVSDRHVTLGWGRDFADVSPIKGVITGGGKHVMRVSVDVAPVVAEDDPGTAE